MWYFGVCVSVVCLCIAGTHMQAGGCSNHMSMNTMFIDRELHIKKLVLFISEYVVWKCI